MPVPFDRLVSALCLSLNKRELPPQSDYGQRQKARDLKTEPACATIKYLQQLLNSLQLTPVFANGRIAVLKFPVCIIKITSCDMCK